MDLLPHGAQLDGHADRAGREARVPAGQGQRQRVLVKASGPGLGLGMVRAVVQAAGLGLGMARAVVRAVPAGPHARLAPR
jgi:hypothetical protein